MKLSVILVAVASVVVLAAPMRTARGTIISLAATWTLIMLAGTDLDERIAYPDEKLYAEEYKRDADLDERIAYPDEKLYAEEYKRCEQLSTWRKK